MVCSIYDNISYDLKKHIYKNQNIPKHLLGKCDYWSQFQYPNYEYAFKKRNVKVYGKNDNNPASLSAKVFIMNFKKILI